MFGGPSIRSFGPRPLRLVDAVALAAVIAWAVVLLFGLPPRTPTSDSMAMVDYGLNTRQAVIIDTMVAKARTGPNAMQGGDIVYPNHYAYPPAFVVLMLLWLKLGSWAFPAWLVLIMGALVASLIAGARFTGIGAAPGRFAVAALAVALTLYALGWDLRTRNVNLIYLAVALIGVACAARRPAAGGLLLSLSAALKLYSVLFLPWLAWRRQWRALAWMLAGLAVWFVLLPGMWFGWPGAWRLTWAWLDALRLIGQPAYQDIFPGYLVTLPRAVSWLVGEPTADPLVIAITRAVQLAWLGLVVWRIWRGALSAAAEAALLVLLPLPFAPLLQPHHLVVFLLPALVLLAEAIGRDVPMRRRIAAALAAIGAGVLMQTGPAGGGRALATMLTTVLLAAAMAQRRRL